MGTIKRGQVDDLPFEKGHWNRGGNDWRREWMYLLATKLPCQVALMLAGILVCRCSLHSRCIILPPVPSQICPLAGLDSWCTAPLTAGSAESFNLAADSYCWILCPLQIRSFAWRDDIVLSLSPMSFSIRHQPKSHKNPSSRRGKLPSLPLISILFQIILIYF